MCSIKWLQNSSLLPCYIPLAHSHIVFQHLILISYYLNIFKLFMSEMLTVFKGRCHFDRISSPKDVETVRGVRSYQHWKSEDGEVWSKLFWRSISLRAPSRHLWNSFNQTHVCISPSPWMCTRLDWQASQAQHYKTQVPSLHCPTCNCIKGQECSWGASKSSDFGALQSRQEKYMENKGVIEGSLNRNFRQYGELKSSREVKSVE